MKLVTVLHDSPKPTATKDLDRFVVYPLERKGFDNDELAYIAGFINGEGTFAMTPKRRRKISLGAQYYFEPTLEIANIDRAVLEWIRSVVGGGDIRKVSRHRWKTCWRLAVWKRESLMRLIEALLPYLKVKRQQAEIFQNFFEMHPLHIPSYTIFKDWELYFKLRSLHGQERAWKYTHSDIPPYTPRTLLKKGEVMEIIRNFLNKHSLTQAELARSRRPSGNGLKHTHGQTFELHIRLQTLQSCSGA
ncbi:MAG: LAGLIDADG endonuclease [Candidatus Bathyarchaeota archaeon BA1]|nr:MAG: LAGLIDADG endonuclease [Candidatus Bathyarchaeota archaeon BA1]